MATLIDARQTRSRDTLSQLVNAADVALDTILRAIDVEVTPTFNMTVPGTGRILTINAPTKANPTTAKNRASLPIGTSYPTFTTVTVTLDATGAGNATPSVGTALALAMTASQFMRIGMAIDASGNIILTKGTAASSLAAAGYPSVPSSTIAVGYLVARTDGSNNVANVLLSDLYQYAGGGGGSSSGSGEINVIANPSDSTNWGTSGAGMTVGTTTTVTDLPLNGVLTTAIKFTPVSGTDYARYRWTMPTALIGKREKIDWFQHPLAGYVAGDVKIEVWTNTASDYSGSYTRVNLFGDISGVSAIPAGDGRYLNAFDATAALYYEFRVVRVAGTTAINVTNVVIGPGTGSSAPIVDLPVAIAPTYDNLGTVTANEATGTRTGGRLKVQGRVTTGTIVAGTPAIVLPAGFTIVTGSAGLSTNASGQRVGKVSLIAISASEIDQVVEYALFFDGSTTNKLFISERTQSGAYKKHNATDFLANGDVLSYEFDLPISEYEGNGGSLSSGSNSIEYLYNTNTSINTSDTTSFAYGSGGAAFVSIVSAGATVKKRVRTQRPMGATSGKPVLEISPNGVNFFKAETILGYLEVGTERYGMHLVAGGTALTDVDVEFGGDGATGTEAWSVYAGWVWRVVVEQPGVAVGYGLADANNPGFISNVSQSIYGAKTWQDIQTWMAVAGTVVAGSYNTSGAWTFGPTSGGSVTHVFRSGASSLLRLQAATTADNGQLSFHNSSSDRYQLLYSGSADTLTINTATVVASTLTLAGQWTFGPTTLTTPHGYNGGMVANPAQASGSISNASGMNMMSNLYYDAASAARAIATATGYVQLRTLRQSTSSGEVLQLFCNYQDAQTAGSTAVTTNDTKLFSATADGAFTFGTTTSAGSTHLFRSGGQTNFDIRSGTAAEAGIRFQPNAGATTAFVGAAGHTGGFVNGSATGDLVLRAEATNIIFTTTSGSTISGSIAATTGAWTLGNAANTSASHTIQGTMADYALKVTNGRGIASSDGGVLVGMSTTAAPALRLQQISGSANIFQVNGNGVVTINTGSWGTGGTAVGINAGVLTTSPSSLRYKKNVLELSEEVDTSEIFNLRPVTFDYKRDDRHSFGFIAEEVEAVMPCLVHHEPDEDGNLRPESVAYDHLSILLLAELKKLRQEVDVLKAEYSAYVTAHS